MQPVVTTSNDATFGTQHDTLTDSAQWNTGTADNNYDAAAPFNDQGPPKNDYATNVETAVMGTNTLNDANYPDSRYVQQQNDVQAAPLMDAQQPMMADVHDLQQQQEVEVQHQQPPQGQPQNYEAQTNGGGYHSELTPPNNQEPAPSGTAVEEEMATNDQPMSSQPQAMTTDYATQPMQTQQEPEPSLNGAQTEMTTTSAMTDTPIITTTTTTSTMTGTTEEVKSHKVQIVTHQAGPQQAGISGSEKTEESPNYSSTRDSSTITQVANHAQAMPMPQKMNSWAALTQHAARGPSPKRQPQIIARDRMNESVLPRKGQTKSSKNPETIRSWVTAAINQRRTIWISYNGHQKPFIPRCIEPKKWDPRGNSSNPREASFFAVQFKSKSRNQQRFFLRNVLEVRSAVWRIPEAELRKLRKQYPNAGQNSGGGGGGGYGGNQGQNSGQGQNNSMGDRPRYGGGGNNKRNDGRGQRYGGNQGNNSRMASSGNMQ